ncbi:uncharacterized protein LOC104893353 [Beta vulgaris subsp. vulgaris]|uniref:uncharacterized protein LOC104893353 n=1 Tax=Beta vulgaris subsp. vulgaris TaxID=3555 RepID=UPI0025485AA7|nr:uncharacterized protein LOC104893353 [Beta vulgaris subsp. vulgaris]
MLNNPQFLAMFQAFVNQNAPQNLSPGTQHPTSQRVDPYPTTPGGDSSSNRMRVENQFPTQSLDDDEDVVQVQVPEPQVTISKQVKDRWVAEEDRHLVSAYLNCSGDPEKGTDREKGALWLEIKVAYEATTAKTPNVMHKRTMRVIKRRWSQINEGVTLWVAQLAVVQRMQTSGEVINDIEAKAHDLYRQKKDKAFEFYHCWEAMHHLTRWMPGKDSTVVSEGSSKRSSDEAGTSMRPDGWKKMKAQNKLKGVATSLDEFNNTLSAMQNERGLMRKGMSYMLEYQKQRDETKMRFKMFQLLMTKSYLKPFEEENLAKLKEEFMKSLICF